MNSSLKRPLVFINAGIVTPGDLIEVWSVSKGYSHEYAARDCVYALPLDCYYAKVNKKTVVNLTPKDRVDFE